MEHQLADPFQNVERAARRQKLEDTSARAISQARTKLILGKDAKSAFFAVLALRLKPIPDWDCDTAATDGKLLVYNPEYIDTLALEQRIGLIAHEVMHNAMGHMARRGSREMRRWNIAADLAVNSILVNTGFVLPDGGCVPGKGSFTKMPPGQTAEWYYSKLQEQGGAGQAGEACDDGLPGAGEDPGRCGATRDASKDQAEKHQAEQDWQVAVAEAERQAKSRGDLPAGLSRAVGEIITPKVDWRDVLRRFVSASARNDYAWSPPNRRFISQGMYLPSLRSEELGDVAIAVDTSGSISQQMLNDFAAEIQGVLEAYSVRLRVLYHDSKVAHEQEWCSTDGPLELEAKGGGGTSHQPVFERLAEDTPPTCLICLTDADTIYPVEAPAYPVLWALPGPDYDRHKNDVPFGEVLRVE